MNMKHLRWTGSALLALGMITGGCGPKSAASDQTLTTNIQSQLYADSTTRQANVNVAVKDGVVTLSGDVPSSDVELQAMKIANGTAGVRSVSDQMKVNGTMAANPMPANALNAGDSSAKPMVAPNALAPTHSAPPPAAAPSDSTPSPSVASSSSKEDAEPTPKRRPSEPESVTIPAGDRLSVRTVDAIDSGRATEGQTFRATLDAPLVSSGRVVVPAGAPVSVAVQSVKGAGRIKGSSELTLRVTGLEYGGRNYPVNSTVYSDEGKARGKQTAVKTGVGAAAGAVIGAIAGGGKGAAIGSAAGGGAGFGWNALTHGQQIKIPSESVLSFRLEAPLTVRVAR